MPERAVPGHESSPGRRSGHPPGRWGEDLVRARAAVQEAECTPRAADRYLAAHRAVLRTAAILLALRSHPATVPRRGRPQDAWALLATVAPEFAEWAGYFAATTGRCDAARAGAVIGSREADDLVRDAQAFLTLVHRVLERSGRRAAPGTGGSGPA